MSADLPVVISGVSSGENAIAATAPRASTWVLVWGIALASRLAAAFFLPNAEQDGYSYAESIAHLSARIASGDLRITDLFGFWLPLFQFVSAIPNIWIHDPIVAGKLVNALCGTATCVLVFALTEKVTRNLVFAWLTFALILLNPLHILYSAACMTDVPHSCMVLASLWCVSRRQWIGAAIFAAVAESLRIEAWALLFVLPLIQLAWERRVSIAILAILIAPPAAWLVINYYATGDLFAYFADRARYHAAYIEFHPTRSGFTFADVHQDVSYFGLGANRIVFLGSIAAAAILMRQVTIRTQELCWLAIAMAAYGAALAGVLLLAYVTKRQPVILPRYGLASFCVGLPLLAWLLQFVVEQSKHRRWAVFFAAAIFALTVVEMRPQIPNITKVLDDFQAHQRIAQALDSSLPFDEKTSRCFSDDVAIRVMAHQPPGRFLRSETVPRSASQNETKFGRYLRDQHVSHLVFFRTENSLPVKFYPQLGQSEHLETAGFELLTMARSSFGPDLWLYRLDTAGR